MCGSLLRYWVAGWVQRASNGAFPTGTLAVNLVGSFALGFVVALSLERGRLGADLRLFLAVGVCGGFTTMSAFSYETLQLVSSGSLQLALWNVAGTITGCLLATWLGVIVGRVL